MRVETDALGTLELGDDCLWGINTERARQNFALGQHPVRWPLIRALVLVKKAAAMAYRELGMSDAAKQDAIIAACDRILAGGCEECFVVDALQGGAGTSTNMNVNEVVANLALGILGERHGRYDLVHPLDDVNRGQSTNDVYPTALRIAAIGEIRVLSEEAARLQTALQTRENEWDELEKLGRTELMDAVPVTLGQEFGAYAQAIARDRRRSSTL